MIPSFLVASAVTQLGSVFVGPNIEPFNGIDLFGGWATTNVTGLAKGTSLNQVLLPVGSSGAAPTVNTATHVKGGYAFGVGFDISVFLTTVWQSARAVIAITHRWIIIPAGTLAAGAPIVCTFSLSERQRQFVIVTGRCRVA